jgi:hypothetical protein
MLRNQLINGFQLALFWSTKPSFPASIGRKVPEGAVTAARTKPFPSNAIPSGKKQLLEPLPPFK